MDLGKVRSQCMKLCKLKDDISQTDQLTICYQSLYDTQKESAANLSGVCKVLLDNNFISTTSDILSKLKNQGFHLTGELTQLIFKVLMNYTDCNETICSSVLSSGIRDILISECCQEIYQKNINQKYYSNFLFSIMSVIHNIIRHSGNEEYFKLEDVKRTFLLFINCESISIRLSALLCLSYLVDDRDKQVLNNGKDLIKSLIFYIRKAERIEDRIFEGFSIWEILSGLKMISVNDNMKKAIVKEGGVELVSDILKSNVLDKEVQFATCLLLNLCFDKDIYEDVKKNPGLMKILEPYQENLKQKKDNQNNNMIWMMTDQQRNEKLNLSDEKIDYDAFMSFSKENKVQAKRIYNDLLKNKFRIKINLEKIPGSPLPINCEGIKSSLVFIICVSNTYRTSESCRMEAEYAVKLGKHLIPLLLNKKYDNYGWLGCIIGDRKFIKFNKPLNFLNSIRDLTKEINRYKTPVTNNGIEEDNSNDSLDFSTSTNLKIWTNKNVLEWLEKCDLHQMRIKLKDYNGDMLYSLINIKEKAPKQFYTCLYEEMKLPMAVVTKFDAAVDELITGYR